MNNFSFIIATLVFAFFTLLTTTVSAQSTPEPVSVFVHITALQSDDGIKTGVINKIIYDEGVPAVKKKGILPAKLRKEGNLLQFEIQMLGGARARLKMPKGFTLNEHISKLLGASGQVVMSGGSTMVKKQGKNLLQFEIQD